jgi:ATP-dependent protease ClpP protease subunit
VHFIAGHSRVKKEKLEQMMINTGMLTKDLGTILVGKEAVRQGLIDEVGGISAALEKLRSLMAD